MTSPLKLLTVLLLVLFATQTAFAGRFFWRNGRRYYYNNHHVKRQVVEEKVIININNDYPEADQQYSVAELSQAFTMDPNLALRLGYEDRQDSSRLLQAVIDKGYAGNAQHLETLKLQSYVQGVQAVTGNAPRNIPPVIEFRLEQGEDGQQVYRRYAGRTEGIIQDENGQQQIVDINATALIKKCAECHGLSKSPEPAGEFFLDVNTVVSQPDFEKILNRVFSDDPEKVMPPGKPLNVEEQAGIVKLLLNRRSQ